MREALHIPEEDLIQYALGTLKEAQLCNLTAHFSMCNECRAELGKMSLALATLASVQPQPELPNDLKDRFLKRLENDSPVESKFVRARNRNRAYIATKKFQSWLETPVPMRVLSGTLAVAAIFLAYDDATHLHEIRQLGPAISRYEQQGAEYVQLEEFLRGNQGQHVTLRQTPQLSRLPEGHVLYSAMSGKLIFTASNMPAPPDGKTYALWLIPASGGKPTPAGTFTPDTQGNGAIIFPELPTSLQASGFSVTVEARDGVSEPTTAVILSGQI